MPEVLEALGLPALQGCLEQPVLLELLDLLEIQEILEQMDNLEQPDFQDQLDRRDPLATKDLKVVLAQVEHQGVQDSQAQSGPPVLLEVQVLQDSLVLRDQAERKEVLDKVE
jgi:hypothetical protein